MFSSFQAQTDDLTASQIKILDYINKQIDRIPFLSIDTAAREIGVSNATLTRFTKKMGYGSFKEMKQTLLKNQQISPAEKLKNSAVRNGILTEDLVIYKELDHLVETMNHLDILSLEKAVRLILDSKRIFIFAKGASYGLGHLLSFRLNRFDLQVILVPSSGSDIFEQLNNVHSQDLAILFGFGTVPKEIQVVIDYAKTHTVSSILFTDTLSRRKELSGDLNFYISRGKPKEYHSMASAAALIDTLVVELSKKIPPASQQQLEQLYQLKEAYKKDIPR